MAAGQFPARCSQTEEGFLQIVLRLCTSGDEHGYKNSGNSVIEQLDVQASKDIMNEKLRIKLLQVYKMFNQYHFLQRVAIDRGIEIYNATLGGALDEFERVNLSDVLDRNSKKSDT